MVMVASYVFKPTAGDMLGSSETLPASGGLTRRLRYAEVDSGPPTICAEPFACFWLGIELDRRAVAISRSWRWIQVVADGSAFQCRHSPSGTLFTSKGVFLPPHSIQWRDIWGKDRAEVVDGKLTLWGQWGAFTYHKAKEPLYERCLAASNSR